MRLPVLSLIAISLFAGVVQAKSIVCWSKDFGKRPLQITFDEASAEFSFDGKSCTLSRVAYNPVSPKYAGWIRFKNSNAYDQIKRQTVCQDAMASLFNQGEANPSEFPDVDWISVSTEVQSTGDGVLQLGFENLWDPGAGGTVKKMMGCRPDSRK